MCGILCLRKEVKYFEKQGNVGFNTPREINIPVFMVHEASEIELISFDFEFCNSV